MMKFIWATPTIGAICPWRFTPFLEAFDWTGKTIYPFCTHEGSGLSGTEGEIAVTCQGADVKKGAGHPRFLCRPKAAKLFYNGSNKMKKDGL